VFHLLTRDDKASNLVFFETLKTLCTCVKEITCDTKRSGDTSPPLIYGLQGAKKTSKSLFGLYFDMYDGYEENFDPK